MKTYVYYNLHKHCWSLMRKGKVIGHCDALVVGNAEFRVRPGGRKRVLEEKRKNVHAFVIGSIVTRFEYDKDEIGTTRQVKYNPYKADSFVYADSGEKATQSKLVLMKADRTVWASDKA